MDYISLLKATKQFAKRAQTVSAQPGDVQTVLERAKLWNIQTMVSPMLNQVGVPDDATVNISILVDAGPKIGFNAVLTPQNPKISIALNNLLKQKIGVPMVNAIKSAGLKIDS